MNEDGYGFENTLFSDDFGILPFLKTGVLIGTLRLDILPETESTYLAFSGIFDGNGNTLTVAAGVGIPCLTIQEMRQSKPEPLWRKRSMAMVCDRWFQIMALTENITRAVHQDRLSVMLQLRLNETLRAGLIGGYASGANSIVIENCKAESGVLIGYTGRESSIGTLLVQLMELFATVAVQQL